ncbi:hypothetical protein HMPREF1705_04633 [Acetomicrobium hydrogeniformans ATCC BAA-1850]|uniref:Uncharacterized protein n=1 Tax=Acetomicrobium hydrogeniformans ATCC BAA-1850 TaxID=592015 RepID=A0A0T5XAH5_9BACT|nr:hypothetical protein HMPREF1705_04633 [Acetomicrobium hydrogeniformans ATCC BAA-1850]
MDLSKYQEVPILAMIKITTSNNSLDLIFVDFKKTLPITSSTSDIDIKPMKA